nr:unnamed protein product [Callosobruchus chinensis]
MSIGVVTSNVIVDEQRVSGVPLDILILMYLVTLSRIRLFKNLFTFYLIFISMGLELLVFKSNVSCQDNLGRNQGIKKVLKSQVPKSEVKDELVLIDDCDSDDFQINIEQGNSASVNMPLSAPEFFNLASKIVPAEFDGSEDKLTHF